MSTSEILLGIVLVLFTAFNIYILTIGKKKRQAVAQSYKKTFSELANKTIAEAEKNNVKLDDKHFYLNDVAEGVQLSFDKESRKMAITLKDAFHLIPFSDVQPCSVQHDESNGKCSNIRVEVRTADKVIPIVFGKEARRPKSFLGKMVIENATEFCNVINAYCIHSVQPK
jgi:hypothetical protein